ncbi:acyl-coenzyme A thioesterase 1-like [Ambystoma mexicanum]|uniref:acyl-coenzyme A thioesterase 1-like n=1 Tax=Ambystoma mexicanum TaxID=8296 RepID=UPI0037E795BF
MLPNLRRALLFRHCWLAGAPAARCKGAMSAAVTLDITPSPKCLFDEPVSISVRGLSPLQAVTLRASLTDETGVLFRSSAQYTAESSGELDLTRSPSLGGSYTGVEPMGLVWSLLPETPFRRLVKRDVLSPFYLNLEVYEGHGTAGQPLAKATNERAFLGEGVQRIPVREGKIRATFFQPVGVGPFPGIIDIYGTGGGLPEYRASLLASRGFATLALAYYGYEDLPKQMKEFHLEYFEDAVNYMLGHPQVRGPGIGLLGHSKGGDLVVSMASFLKGITATATVNGAIVTVGATLRYKDVIMPPIGADLKRIKLVKPGLANVVEALNSPLEAENRKYLIPIEKAEGKFLFIVGEDDQNWKSELYANMAADILLEHGKEKPEIVVYPGAGHYIEPPVFPMCAASMHFLVGLPVVWGGEPRAHFLAQEGAWQKIQGFFCKHLAEESLQSRL